MCIALESLVSARLFGTLGETPSVSRIRSSGVCLSALFCPQTPDLEPLEPTLEDVENINDFEPLFSEETHEVEKPQVTTVQV